MHDTIIILLILLVVAVVVVEFQVKPCYILVGSIEPIVSRAILL